MAVKLAVCRSCTTAKNLTTVHTAENSSCGPAECSHHHTEMDPLSTPCSEAAAILYDAKNVVQ